MAEAHPGPNGDQASGEVAGFPSYEELASELLGGLDSVGLSIEDVRHELEPGVGERRFECTVRLQAQDPPSRYHAHLTFSWDALLTHIAAYGPGADCDLYHDDEEEQDCPHRRLRPQPSIELEGEFVLGDGGYELHSTGEVSSWIDTVQSLLAPVFPEDDRPSVHVGLAALGGTMLVEKLTAEVAWVLDFDEAPDFAAVARQVQRALKVIPQLADRLPI